MSTRVHIALVEDNPADVYLFRYSLREMGYEDNVELQVFDSGVTALEGLQASQPPDLLVLDWFLPILEAPEVIERVRKLPHCAKLPIAVFAGPETFRKQAARLGAVCSLTKPIDETQLRTLLNSVGPDAH
jgi:CheY-like chemotaxis protein